MAHSIASYWAGCHMRAGELWVAIDRLHGEHTVTLHGLAVIPPMSQAQTAVPWLPVEWDCREWDCRVDSRCVMLVLVLVCFAAAATCRHPFKRLVQRAFPWVRGTEREGKIEQCPVYHH